MGSGIFLVPGAVLTQVKPLLFILAAAGLVLNTVIAQPCTALIGLGIVFPGAPAYLIWRRPKEPTLTSL